MSLALLLTVFLSTGARAQHHRPPTFEEWLARGKAEYKSESADNLQFGRAVAALEQAVKLRPNHAEAHYFLGYAYARLNAPNANHLLAESTGLMLCASRACERVIALAPHYTGELLSLDPYAKLTSLWGATALRFVVVGQLDSARWAFGEGQRRGGFTPVELASARAALRACSSKATLISYGDSYAFAILYVQVLEGVRPDVRSFNVDLLASYWYPRFLITRYPGLSFGVPDAALDTLDFGLHPDTLLTLNLRSPGALRSPSMQWSCGRALFMGVLLREQRLLLSLLQTDALVTPLYFTKGLPVFKRLGLSDEWLEAGLHADELVPGRSQRFSLAFFEALAGADFGDWLAGGSALRNSPSQLAILDGLRLTYAEGAYELHRRGQTAAARQLLATMARKLPEAQAPMRPEVRHYLEARLPVALRN